MDRIPTGVYYISAHEPKTTTPPPPHPLNPIAASQFSYRPMYPACGIIPLRSSITRCGWLFTTLPSSLPFHVPSSSLNDVLLRCVCVYVCWRRAVHIVCVVVVLLIGASSSRSSNSTTIHARGMAKQMKQTYIRNTRAQNTHTQETIFLVLRGRHTKQRE